VSGWGLSEAGHLLVPHLAAVGLIAARLLPIVFLCPLWGGQLLPGFVKLALALSLASSLHVLCGLDAPSAIMASSWALGAAVARESIFGLALGLVASLPFEAARMGGRFMDLFRGASAEAALPQAGTRESATGDGLYQLLVALGAASPLFSLVTRAFLSSFGLVKLGAFAATESLVLQTASLIGVAFGAGLAVGAPMAAWSLAVDALLGLLGRTAPQLTLHPLGPPLRILGGGAVLWLAVGIVAGRLLEEASAIPTTLRAMLGA
jgi:flagellar biosynthesis protein FliR